MANAIKQISVARGYDVTRYTLQCFGGAGGQHACLVADALGMTRVFVHPLAGVLSAYGMGLADQTVMREQAVELPLDAGAPGRSARARSTRWPPTAAAELQRQGVGARRASACAARVHLRYEGTDSALVVPFGDRGRDPGGVRGRLPAALRLPDAGRARWSSRRCRSKRSAPATRRPRPRMPLHAARAGAASRHRAHVQRRPLARRRARRARADLRPGDVDRRPGDHRRDATPPPWSSPAGRRSVTALDHLVLERVRAARERVARSAPTVDPVLLEVFNNLFMNIAEQMGLQLQNTAYSVNIKERLDFSCALFDADGNLIANAPHMPVHLGSMSESDQDRDRAQRRARCSRATCTCSTTRTTAARTCPTSPWSRRCSTTAGEHDPVLRRLARPPCRHRRHHAGLDAAVLARASKKKAC